MQDTGDQYLTLWLLMYIALAAARENIFEKNGGQMGLVPVTPGYYMSTRGIRRPK